MSRRKGEVGGGGGGGGPESNRKKSSNEFINIPEVAGDVDAQLSVFSLTFNDHKSKRKEKNCYDNH